MPQFVLSVIRYWRAERLFGQRLFRIVPVDPARRASEENLTGEILQVLTQEVQQTFDARRLRDEGL